MQFRSVSAALVFGLLATGAGGCGGKQDTGVKGPSGPAAPAAASETRVHRDTRACNQGVPEACNELGVLLEKGDETPKDARRAVELFDRACGQGLGQACTNLAAMHAVGEG